jgi:signal transduction histidine kinase
MPPDKKAIGIDTAIRNYPALLRRYIHLLEITRNLTSTVQMEEIFHQVVEGAVTLMECESSVLFLLEIPSGDLHLIRAVGVDPAAYRNLVVPQGTSLAGRVLSAGTTMMMDRQSEQFRAGFFERNGLPPIQPRSILAVPLKGKTGPIGVLEAINKIHGAFQPEDFSTLEGLASQAAVTIESLRLSHQSDLITELVHEIRTPLSALATAVALLDRQDLNESQRHNVLSTLRQEIQRLTDLTNDYLDLARLESGRVQLQAEHFSVSALISESVEITSPLIRAQGLYLRQELPRDPMELVADRSKIKQVILNLVSNAVKYNVPGGEVILRAFRDPAAPDHPDSICIEVADTGRGIPAESLPQVFERFFRAQEGSALSRGTGLGLYIARHIVESHHGRIEVHSQVGQGTTFTVRLPTVPPGRSTGPLKKTGPMKME